MTDVVVAKANAVEQGLDATRTRLGGHLDQLRERMTPGQVLDDVVRYFRGREGADFGRNLLSNVKDNPLPAAVTGVGLVWLMATNGRTAVTKSNSVVTSEPMRRDRAHEAFISRRDEINDVRARVRMAEQSVTRGNEESEDAYLMRREDALGYAIGIARQPQDTHESFRGRIQSFLADSKDSLCRWSSGCKKSTWRCRLVLCRRLQRLRVNGSRGCLRCCQQRRRRHVGRRSGSDAGWQPLGSGPHRQSIPYGHAQFGRRRSSGSAAAAVGG